MRMFLNMKNGCVQMRCDRCVLSTLFVLITIQPSRLCTISIADRNRIGRKALVVWQRSYDGVPTRCRLTSSHLPGAGVDGLGDGSQQQRSRDFQLRACERISSTDIPINTSSCLLRFALFRLGAELAILSINAHVSCCW